MRATHNRERIAARITSTTSHTRTTGPVSTDLLARVPDVIVLRDSTVKRSKRSKGRGVGTNQRDSRGYRSDWTRSPYAPRGGWR